MKTSSDKPELDVLLDLMEKAEVQGFLMTDDIMEAFPEVEESLEQLEDVFISLQEAGIEIFDNKPAAKAKAEVEDEDPFEEDDSNFDLSGISSDDTVGLYLKEMARVPLLTIEEEVHLAKRLESGNHAAIPPRIVAGHGSVVVQAQNLAKVSIEILGRFQFLSISGSDEHFAVGTESDAMAVMSPSGDFRFLDPQFFS